MRRKIFSILLSLCMLFTMMPSMAITAWAVEETPDYLCFTAVEPGACLYFFKNGTPDPISLQYSTDSTNWEDYNIKSNYSGKFINLDNIGDKVYFRAKNKNEKFSKGINDDYYSFFVGGEDDPKIAASGNVMSLVDSTCESKTIPCDYCFAGLFAHADTLTTFPEVPATTLRKGCYANMFAGCDLLTTAPELPATTLADECYSYMFQYCQNLIEAPELPATTLASNCYSNMFYECNSLKSITMLATDLSANKSLDNWTYGVASTGTFIKNSSTNADTIGHGTNGIPNGWTVMDYDEEPASDWEGSGTSAEPYLISNKAGLEKLATEVNNGDNFEGKYFEVTDDIDDVTKVIGTNLQFFKGIFNGAGHTITLNMEINDEGRAGLFSYNQGTIKNLTIAGSVRSKASMYSRAAGICTINEATGIIDNCHNSASIYAQATNPTSGKAYCAGIVAENNGTIINSRNSGNVEGCAPYIIYVGGIAGTDSVNNGANGNFRNCYNEGCLKTSNSGVSYIVYIGGIVALHNRNVFTANCYSCGEIKDESQCTDKRIGGVFGNGVDDIQYSKDYNCFYDKNKYEGDSVGKGPGSVATGLTTAQMQAASGTIFSGTGSALDGKALVDLLNSYEESDGAGYPEGWLPWEIKSVGDYPTFGALPTPEEVTYSITNLASEASEDANHGHITLDKTEATAGSTVKITVVPSDCYALEENGLTIQTSGGTTVEVSADAENTYTFIMPDVDVTVSAQFKDIYTKTIITFDKQGGTGGTVTADAYINQQVPTVNIPERTGYTFDGYFDEASGGTRYYDNYGYATWDAGYKVWDKKVSTATLYAHWAPIKVKLHLDNGIDTNFVEVAYDAVIPGVTPPTRYGYVFNGYWDESKNERIFDASGNPVQKTVSKYTEDQYFTACWENTEHVADHENDGGITGLNVEIYHNKSKYHLQGYYTVTDKISHKLYYNIVATSPNDKSVEFTVIPMHQAYEHGEATGDATLLTVPEGNNMEMLIYLPNSMRNADRLYAKHVKGDGTTYYMNTDEQVRFDDHIKIYNSHGFDGTDKFVISTEKFNDPEFTGHSLILGGDIGLNFYMDIPEEFKDGEMTFKVSGKGGFTTSDAGVFVPEYGEYRYTCNLNALQMGAKVKATYTKENYHRTAEYSIAEYINRAKTVGGVDMRALANKMQAYGYFAQLYLREIHGFEIGAGDSAYAPIDMPSKEPNLSINLNDYKADVSANGNEEITKTEISLKLESKIGLKLHMTLSGSSDYASSEPSITVDGEQLDSDNIKFEDGKMVLSINDIPTLELGHTYTVVVDGTYKVKVSALTFAKGLMENDTNTYAKQLGAALYEYYKAAMTYAELEED